MNISGAFRSLVGSDDNSSVINDAVGFLVSLIRVPFFPPLAEFFALMDVGWVIYKEYIVVRAVWGGGMVNSKGDF